VGQYRFERRADNGGTTLRDRGWVAICKLYTREGEAGLAKLGTIIVPKLKLPTDKLQ
jgi:hypothetical protein